MPAPTSIPLALPLFALLALLAAFPLLPSLSPSMPPPRRVLAVGDSLTEGFTAGGAVFHPYAIRLRALLAERFPDDKFEVEVLGFSGFRSREVRGRLDAHFARNRDAQLGYAAVMCGTNDAGDLASLPERSFPAALDAVVAELEAMHEAVIARGAKLLVMNLPDVWAGGAAASPVYFARRDQLRSRIRVLAERYSKEGKPVAYLDPEPLIPLREGTTRIADDPRKRGNWDRDGLHMTAKGYDALGELVFGKLFDEAEPG
ncbi:SGNH hydrolase-type esterase domain-containing protein [Hyaloraphidium curvatum]|nr:SGNH hydrolase-type esterase domain-containing protein [Hyaloraphidium curvatum]